MQRIISITFLLFDSFSNHCLANTLEPLRAANNLSGKDLFQWTIATVDSGNVISSSGLEFVPNGKLSELRGDLLIVMPSYGYLEHGIDRNLRAIRAASNRFEHVAGFDTGSWLLAQAGLIDGFDATIHWDEFTRFEEAFPDVNARRERMVWDRNRLSCVGAAAGFDVAMDLVGRQHGKALRLEVALLFMGSDVVSEPRDYAAGQAQVSKAVNLMRENLETPLPLSQIAREIGTTRRALNTQMKAEFGETAVSVYRRLRLLKAKRLLLETDLTIAEITLRAGYEDVSAMTRAFRRSFGTTPGKLR